MDSFDMLKFNLQEEKYPYFSEDELETLLETYPDVNQATYEGCLIKSADDSVKLGPITIPDNSKYWLTRAAHFRQKYLQSVRSKSPGVSMGRADEQWR